MNRQGRVGRYEMILGLFERFAGTSKSVGLVCVVLVAIVLVSSENWAADKSNGILPLNGSQASATKEVSADDPLGRSTPQGAVMGFMKSMGREDYERAIEYLDTRQPPKRAEQLARELQFVLDRGLVNSLATLNRLPEGDLRDGLPPEREIVGVVKAGGEKVDIELERVQRGSEPAVWLFSSDTLRHVQRAYDQMSVPFVERFVPDVLLQKKVLHFSLWRWISYLVVLPLLFFLSRAASVALLALFRPLIRRLAKRDDEGPMQRVKNPFSLFVLALAIYVYSPLTQSALGRLWLNQVALVLTVVSVTWLCLRLIDVLTERVVCSYQLTVASGRIAITRLGGQFSKGLAIVIGAAVILYSAGINLTAVLTGLGVGGIAIAFAAQKTLENLFGGIMIASDQPIRVGDFCRAGEYSGTVESIGLRSTRIRTIDRTVVSVPNGQLSVMSLENFAMRDKMKFQHSIALRPESSAEQLRYMLTEIGKMLKGHPRIEESGARVRLVAVKSAGFEIELFAYIVASSWDMFLEVQEELLVGVIGIVEASGALFVSASPGLSLGTDSGMELSRARKNDKVGGQKRRAQGELGLPK